MKPNLLVRTIFILCFTLFFSATASAADMWAADSNTGCKVWLRLPEGVSNILLNWTGPIVAGKAEGKGVLTYSYQLKNGREFKAWADGGMKGGKLNGKVSFKLRAGANYEASYDGFYRDGLKEGYGIEQVSGNYEGKKFALTYEGGFKAGEYDGKGVMRGDSIIIYEGDYKAGKRDGKGIMRRSDGTIYYEGYFKGNVYEGPGIERYADGTISYEGGFKAGRYEGKGVQRWPDGSIKYQGDFNAGYYDGQGSYKDSPEHYRHGSYEGGFKAGKHDGKGILKEYGSIYEGDFVAGYKDGKGACTERDGSVYEGDFKNGKMDGKGVWRDFDGSSVYVGDYRDGLKHGKGIYKYFDGSLYEGEWEKDLRSGYGVLKDVGGKVICEGQWKDGMAAWAQQQQLEQQEQQRKQQEQEQQQLYQQLQQNRCPVEGFLELGIPWGASAGQLDAALTAKGFSLRNRASANHIDIVEYNGTYAGSPCRLSFSLKNDAVFLAHAESTGFARGIADNSKIQYRAGQLESMLSEKFGPPLPDDHRQPDIYYLHWRWLKDAASADDVKVTMLVKLGLKDTIGCVNVTYINTSLRERLNIY